MIPLVVLLVLALQPLFLALQPLVLARQPLVLALQDHQKVHPQYLREMETHEEPNWMV